MVPMVRIKCTDKLGNVAYIHRFNDGAVTCMLANSIPAALSYAGVLGDEVAFKAQISDIEDGQAIVDLLNLCKPRGQTYEWVNKPAPAGHAVDIAAAKAKLLEVLAEHMPGWTPTVHYWEPPGQGLRVVEIDWMQDNPEPPVKQSGISCLGDDAAPVHFFAERYLLAILFEEDDTVQEARDSLLAALA